MNTLAFELRDSTTLLRRDILHSLRFPIMTISGLIVPVFLLVLFVGIFGNTLHAGLGIGSLVGSHYIDYLTPGIILMAASSGAQATAVNVSLDMNEGFIARLKTMAISRTSVLTGQVLGSLARTLLSGVLVVATAIAIGFRPTAIPIEWLAAAGVFALFALALTWLSVAFGLVAKTPAGANTMALIFVVLPFISSTYVPTDSMPGGVGWFAKNQPFTPVIETLRGLLTGTSIGSSAIIACAWCIGLAVLGYLWARARYEHNPAQIRENSLFAAK